MRFRLELFVDDVEISTRFYVDGLGFVVERRESGYAHLRRGDAELGLAAMARLPERGPGPGFTRERLAVARGTGVEIVLEVDDLEGMAQAVARAGFSIIEPLQERPWGLVDFRVADPDGYYVRITSR